METINKSSSNFNQALWLAIGQLANFLSAFLGAAILSRYFDKVEYGTYRQILYVYMTMQSLFTAGLPSVFAYFIPRMNSGEQKTLVNNVTRLFLYLGVSFSIALFTLSGLIANLLNNPELAIGLKIFSVFPLFTLPTLGVEGIYTALRKTKTIAIYHLYSKSLMLICTVAPVLLFNTGYKGAVIGWGTASFLTFIVAIYLKNKPYVRIEKEIVPNLYKMVFNYSLPLMGAFIAGFFISSADQFFISRFFGTERFAEYSNGALSIPIVALVASPVKNILIPLFSKADSEGNMQQAVKTYNNAVINTSIIVFPVIIFSMFYAKEIMIFIYGEKYIASAGFLRFYIIRDFLSVFPYYSVLLALGMSRIYFYMHLVGVLYIWGLNIISIHLGFGAHSVVIIATTFYIFSSIFAFSYIYKRTRLNLINIKLLRRIFYISIHTVTSAFIIHMFINYNTVNANTFAILLVSVSAFYSLLFLSGKLFKINYLGFLAKFLNNRLKVNK